MNNHITRFQPPACSKYHGARKVPEQSRILMAKQTDTFACRQIDARHNDSLRQIGGGTVKTQATFDALLARCFMPTADIESRGSD
jgi:hypothetical protein